MANLIEQQNQLKGLSDEQLQQEGSSPSGSMPPFLVMTEINRRKSARDAYTAQQGRRKPSTTVAEDLLSNPLGMPGRTAAGAGMPRDSGGIGIAAAMAPGMSAPTEPSGIQAFANGGLVKDDVLSRIFQRREAALSGVDEDREKVRARTMIAAGAAMMGNGSSNFMKNIGAGLTGGLDSWQEQAKMIDSREGAALDGMMGVHSAEQAERLAALDEQFRRDQEARLASQFQQEVSAPTADIKNHQYFEGLDLEGQGNFMRVNGGGASADATARSRAMAAYNSLREDAVKAVNIKYERDPRVWSDDPVEKAAFEAEKAAEVKAQTDSAFSISYPDYVTLMPELTSAPAGGTATLPAGVHDWTTYMQ